MPDLQRRPDGPDTSALGRAFTHESDLVPLYLMRFDRENTRRAYANDLQAFFGTPVVTLALATQITFGDVNEALRRFEAEGKSPATRRRFIATLRGFFSWLTALGFIDVNPADRHLVRRIPKNADEDGVITVLSREEASRMLSTIDLERRTGPRDFALVSTLLHCVLRRSEAAAMDVDDITQIGAHTVLTIRQAKGGANQTIKVPDRLAKTLAHYLASQGYRSGPVWRSFSSNGSGGKRLSTSYIYRIVNRLATEAGIRNTVGAHTLRHTGCTLAIEGGASLQQVQSHARHKNIETTMRYVHQRDRLANSAADFIDL